MTNSGGHAVKGTSELAYFVARLLEAISLATDPAGIAPEFASRLAADYARLAARAARNGK